jgi:hypothetical protein
MGKEYAFHAEIAEFFSQIAKGKPCGLKEICESVAAKLHLLSGLCVYSLSVLCVEERECFSPKVTNRIQSCRELATEKVVALVLSLVPLWLKTEFIACET